MALLFLDGLQDLGLLALRIVLGVVFLYHGLPKLKMSAEMAKAMGKPTSFVILLGLVESISGLALIIGFLTQIAALLLGIVMLGAIYHKIKLWKVPFVAMDKAGWEFDLVLLAIAIALLLLGAGSISFDALFAWI